MRWPHQTPAMSDVHRPDRKVARSVCANQRRWRMHPELSALFEMQRASEFRRMVDLWWPVLPMIHIVLMLFGILTLWRYPMGQPEWLHLGISGFGCLVIGFSVWWARRPHGLMSREHWTPWAAFSMIATIAEGVAIYDRPGYVQYSFMMCTLIVIIYMWALRPSLPAATKFVALNMAVVPLLWYVPQTSLPSVYAVHLSLVCLVCLFCVFLRDDQDRDHFLKAVQLHEAETRLKAVNHDLDEMAHRDALTNLLNRRALNEALHRECQRATRGKTPLAVLMIDIDYFKHFNDLHGHLQGDACLASVANALRQALNRPADTIARFGGEEFAVLLPDTDLPGAREVAERLLKHVDDLGLVHGASCVAQHITVSVGGVVSEGHGQIDATQLIDLADEMLYQVKAGGRHSASVRKLA